MGIAMAMPSMLATPRLPDALNLSDGMPISSPRVLNMPPPLLPELIAASVCSILTIDEPSSSRLSADTTPTVTVSANCLPSGLPMTIAQSPTRTSCALPIRTAGSATSSITRSTARSVSSSTPTISAFRYCPCQSTCTSLAPSTT